MTDVPPEPELGPEDRALYEQGVGEFNTGLFFECHETLEDLWTGVRGPSRDFFQGLIQISVALYPLTRGNFGGAKSLFERGLKRLEKYPERYYGLELGALREEARTWLARAQSGDIAPSDVELAALPKCRWASPPGGGAS